MSIDHTIGRNNRRLGVQTPTLQISIVYINKEMRIWILILFIKENKQYQ